MRHDIGVIGVSDSPLEEMTPRSHWLLEANDSERNATMNSTEVQNPRRKLDVFGSVYKSDHVFRKLSFNTITLPQTVVLFYVSSRSQAPHATAVHHAFLCFDAKTWPN